MLDDKPPFPSDEIASRAYDLGVKPLSISNDGKPQYSKSMLESVYTFAESRSLKTCAEAFKQLAEAIDFKPAFEWVLSVEEGVPEDHCVVLLLSYEMPMVFVPRPKTPKQFEVAEKAALDLFIQAHCMFIQEGLPVPFPPARIVIDDPKAIHDCELDKEYLLKIILHNENVKDQGYDLIKDMRMLH